VTVKIRDIASAGELLDRVVRIGANQVQGVAFVVEEEEAPLNEARGEAIRAAEAKARVYADAGGFTLGRLMLVSETMDVPGFPQPMQFREAMADSVPLAPGEQELKVRVLVEWEIRQPN
jgi:uncharacterized protein